ncbi:MAG: hypothetical protein QXY40_00330 [Candidatus Methanomethylicia archaeon]
MAKKSSNMVKKSSGDVHLQYSNKHMNTNTYKDAKKGCIAIIMPQSKIYQA